MATGGTDLMSDEIIHIKCCVCAAKNRTREGETYCIECKEYYCTSCVGMHKDFPPTRGHQILQKGDIKSLGPDGSLPCYPTERCPTHQLEVLSMYCKDHDEIMCASCIALSFSHRSCKNIISIPEEVHNLYQGINLNDVKQKISNTKKIMEEIKITKQDKIQELRTALDTEIESVKAFREELQALLEDMEKATIRELRKEFSKIEESLTGEIHNVESLVKSLNEVASQLNKAAGNKAQEFVSVKSSERIIFKGQETQANHLDATVTKIFFTPVQNIKALLQQYKVLGKVSTNTFEREVSTIKPINQLDLNVSSDKPINTLENDVPTKCGNKTEMDLSLEKNISTNKVKSSDSLSKLENLKCTPKDGLYKVKNTTNIKVKHAHDLYRSIIRGSCVTDDGYLLLADWNQLKLKCMDMSTGKVTTYLHMSQTINAVCMISKTEAVVALDNQSVQFVSLGDKMIPTRILNMNHYCYGIAHIDGKLFVSDLNKTMYIYDLNGQNQRKVTTYEKGNEIFKKTRHITVSGSGDKVFLADQQNGLVVLDIQGNYLFTVRDNKDSGYTGVCTDGRNVFVSEYSSGKIIQFGHDFSVLGEIANFGKNSKPLSLSFDHQNMRLIATDEASKSSNTITILELT